MKLQGRWNRLIVIIALLYMAVTSSCTEDQVTPPSRDTEGPTVTSIVPSDRSKSVPTASSVTVTFSEPVDPSSVDDTTFRVGGVAGNITVSGDAATFTPAREFTRATTYGVTITQGVKDRAGNPMIMAFSSSFTTRSTNTLFVSTTGDDNNPDNPYGTIQGAIDAASPGDHINVLDGTYNVSQTIVLKKQVSIFGGFDSDSYNGDSLSTIRDPGTYPTIVNGASTAFAGNLADSLTLDGLTINSAPGGPPGESSIALGIHDCRDLVVSGNVITAGDGAAGANGNSPSRPAKAPAGGDASAGSNQDGAPGGNASSYGGFSGGAGGNGGTGFNEDGTNGSPGGGPDGGNGGAKGVGNDPDPNTEDGHRGGNGGNPSPRRAAYGVGGESFGSAENGGYVANDGTPGTRGLPGSGGGGGGGGAASVLGIDGGGGGGGGAGGRRGGAGGAGGGGGASLGIVITGPSRVTILDNTITTGNGGNGGDGGTGGQGGAGGDGGPGVNVIGDGGGGGNGGNGGVGQNGGHGGGGGGGPSIGIVAGAFVAMTRSGNMITPGAGGAGGGSGPANSHGDGSAAGNPGASGQSGDVKER